MKRRHGTLTVRNKELIAEVDMTDEAEAMRNASAGCFVVMQKRKMTVDKLFVMIPEKGSEEKAA